MKTVKSYIFGLAAALTLSTGFMACQDDFDAPNIEAPVAANKANITIAELKEMYWQDATNYAETVGAKEDGTHYYISGRVISSDEQSNVFKFISLQDETGAINFSVNSYNLYLNYRRGQAHRQICRSPAVRHTVVLRERLDMAGRLYVARILPRSHRTQRCASGRKTRHGNYQFILRT